MNRIIFFFILFFTTNTWSNVNLITGRSVIQKKAVEINLIDSKNYHVVIFISKDCPCSKGNLDYLNKLSQKFNQFKFIAIHAKKDTSDNLIEEYLKDKKLNFDVINDNNLINTNHFSALKTPHAFIVSPTGEVIYNGGITNSTFPENAKKLYLEDNLNLISQNKEIEYKETKTLGCYIVR